MNEPQSKQVPMVEVPGTFIDAVETLMFEINFHIVDRARDHLFHDHPVKAFAEIGEIFYAADNVDDWLKRLGRGQE
jgi:hypothetical protein